MAGSVLSLSDRVDFLKLMRRQTNSAVHRRMNVLLLLDDGWSVARICEALFIDEGTVRDHRDLYEREGRAGVERLAYPGAASPLRREQMEALAAFVDETVPQTARQVCAFVQDRLGLRYSPNALSKLLKRLGFVHKKPTNVPAKADEAAQRAFVLTVLKPLMDKASPDAPLYFVDATHPSYTGRPAHGWIRRGRTVDSNPTMAARASTSTARCPGPTAPSSTARRTSSHRRRRSVSTTISAPVIPTPNRSR